MARDPVSVEDAAALLADNRIDDAKRAFATIIGSRPKDVRALIGLGDVERAERRYAEALDTYRRARLWRPDHLPLTLRIARTLLDLSRFDEAGACYDAILARRPRHFRALVGRAHTARRQGDHARALAGYGAALVLQPDSLSLRLRNAAALLAQGYADEAAAAWQAILRDDPACAPAWIGIGDVATRRRDFDAALAAYRSAIPLQPGEPRAQIRAADALAGLGQLAAARQALEEVIAAHPGNMAALARLGDLLQRANQPAEARAVLERATAAAPRNARAWVRLARIAAGSDTATQALAILDTAHDTIGDHPTLALGRIDRYLRRGLEADAARALAAARRKFPNSTALRDAAMDLDLVHGRFQAVARAIAILPAQAPRERIRRLRYIGRLAERRRQLDDAAAAYDAAMQLDPARPRGHFDLARVNVARLRADDARANLREAVRLNRGALLVRGRSTNASQSLTGEFVNELRANPAALATARATFVRGDRDGLLAAVRAEPEHTGTAIALFMLMRQQGLLEARPALSGAARIPRRIVQFWNDPQPPADVAELMDSWHALNPGWDYVRYSETAARDWLKAQDDPRLHRAWRAARGVSQRADLFRLAILAAQGGVYADADDRCTDSLDALTATAGLVLWQEMFGSVGNNFIAVEPGHPVIAGALERVIVAMLRGDGESIWFSTGPGLLTRALAGALADGVIALDAFGGDIQVLERHDLRAFCWPGCKAAYKTTARHWLQDEFVRTAASGR